MGPRGSYLGRIGSRRGCHGTPQPGSHLTPHALEAVLSARLGVSSWSLPATDSGWVDLLRHTGVGGLELALDPVREGRSDLSTLRDGLAGLPITILSAMMVVGAKDVLDDLGPGTLVPDALWTETLKAAEINAGLAFDLGLPLVTLRVLPRPVRGGMSARDALIDRIRRLAAPFLGRGMAVALEVGGESTDAMIGLLIDLGRPGIGVSFDPADMIIHGAGDPVEALDLLSSYVHQIRIRDATAPVDSGARGAEVAVGDGVVDWGAFFDVIRSGRLSVPMVITREIGDTRVPDIKAAAALVRAFGIEGITAH